MSKTCPRCNEETKLGDGLLAFPRCPRCLAIVPDDDDGVVFYVDHRPVSMPRYSLEIRSLGGSRCPKCRRAHKLVPHSYIKDEHPVRLWQFTTIDAWRLVMPKAGFRFDGPVYVVISAIMKSAKKDKPTQLVEDVRKSTLSGDVDNVAKGVLDALNERAWHDDSVVSQLLVDQLQASVDVEPGGVVAIGPAHQVPAWYCSPGSLF